MARPDPIQYAERLYGAIRAANFSPISFLAFGNAIKDGVSMRNMPRIAAEPFMRVVGEMVDLEEEVSADDAILVAETVVKAAEVPGEVALAVAEAAPTETVPDVTTQPSDPPASGRNRRRH